MKKLLGSTLAVAMVLCYSNANAELLKNLELSGQLDVQAESTRNVIDFVTRSEGNNAVVGTPTFNDRLNGAQTRLLLNLDWDLLDDVHAHVGMAKLSRVWGNTGGTSVHGIGGGTGQALTADGAAAVLGSVFVNEAYVKIDKMLGHVDVTVGRQGFGEPGDLVIYFGPSVKALHGQAVTALDMARADWNGEWLSLTGIAGKIASTGGAANPDQDLRGLVLTARPSEGLTVTTYLYNRLTHAAGPAGLVNNAKNGGIAGAGVLNGKNDNLYVYGLKGKYASGGLSLSAEFAKNSGQSRNCTARNLKGVCVADSVLDADGTAGSFDNAADSNYTGWAAKIDMAYTMEFEDIAAVTPWLNFSYGTGRSSLDENQNEGFQSIAGDFRPGAISGRFAPNATTPLGSGIPCQNANAALAAGNGICGGAAAATATTSKSDSGGGIGVGSNGLNNRVIWGIGAKITPAMLNQLTMGFSFWDFSFQRVTDYSTVGNLTAVLNNNGFTGNGIGNGNKHIGSELDFDLTWEHSDNVTLSGGVAGYRAGKYIQNLIQDAGGAVAGSQVAVNNVIMAYGDLRIKF